MRYSRTGIVAVLLAVEVFLGGAILWAISGGRTWSMPADFHRVSDEPKTFAPINAGDAPHVRIDDPGSRVVITASADGKVHVTDAWRTMGLVWGRAQRPDLSVARTADGVSIRRAEGRPRFAILGMDRERTEVAVPPGAALEVVRCSGADVTGLSGTVAIRSVGGSIHLSDVDAPSIEASTNDGFIKATNLRVGGGTLHSDDGSIRLGLADANLTVHAQTNDGSIKFDGRRAAQDGDSGSADYQVGTGGGSLQVSTQDGSIHVSTNGAL